MKQLLLAITLISFTTSTSQAQFAGGTGTAEDPYQVATVEQLQEIRNHTDRHFIQTADIDASETVNWNEGKGFNPIGDDVIKFTGNYNGGDYLIEKLFINRGDQNYIGFFGYIVNSNIQNVSLSTINTTGNSYVAGLVGKAEDSFIYNSSSKGIIIGKSHFVGGLIADNNGDIVKCKTQGEVNGIGSVGGLIGRNTSGDILDSFANTKVTGKEDRIGGLIGTNSGNIKNSYAGGNVNGSHSVGGLIGFSTQGIIEESYSTGDVIGDGTLVGGLIGQNYSGNIIDSYAQGNVHGRGEGGAGGFGYVGGLIGRNGFSHSTGSANGGNIENSHFSGDVRGDRNSVGGLVGQNIGGEISNSYSSAFITSGANYIGGLVGQNGTSVARGGEILESYAIGNVIGSPSSSNNVGGLIGYNNGEVYFSYAKANVEGRVNLGGLIGFNDTGDIVNSYSEGHVEGEVDNIGGLIGINSGEIYNSNASGNVKGMDNVGGLVGSNRLNGNLYRSNAIGSVSGRSFVGGLVGDNHATVKRSYALGIIEGEIGVGGLIGNNISYVNKSYSTSDVVGEHGIGGFVGINRDGGTIDNSYSQGSVSGIMEIGGFVGINRDNALVSKSYSNGLVTGIDEIGGFVGLNGAIIDSCNWNTETSEQENGVGRGSSDGLSGLITEEMNGFSAFENMSHLNFYNKWLLNDNYPALIWEDVESIEPPPIIIDLKSPQNGESNIPVSDTLRWHKDKWIEEYQVQVSTDEDFGTLIIDSTVVDTWMDYESLEEYKNYYWRVKALYLAGDGVWSETWNFTSFIQLPVAIPLQTPENNAFSVGLTPEFSWNEMSDSDFYQFQLSSDRDFSELIVNGDSLDINLYRITNSLDKASEYWWRVRGMNDGGKGQWSKIWRFTTDYRTSADQDDLPITNELQQNYPNPFNPSTIISYSVPDQSHIRLEVFNSLGQRVAILVNETKSAGRYEVTFDATGLSSGLYLYRLQTDQFMESRQMMLVK